VTKNVGIAGVGTDERFSQINRLSCDLRLETVLPVGGQFGTELTASTGCDVAARHSALVTELQYFKVKR